MDRYFNFKCYCLFFNYFIFRDVGNWELNYELFMLLLLGYDED